MIQQLQKLITMNINKSLIFLYFILNVSCHNISNNQNANDLKSEKGLIISCYRCGCLDTQISKYAKLIKSKSEIKIYADTNCFSSLPMEYINFIPQNKIDLIYKNNFNVVLFKFAKNRYQFKVIQTTDAISLTTIADSYFK